MRDAKLWIHPLLAILTLFSNVASADAASADPTSKFETYYSLCRNQPPMMAVGQPMRITYGEFFVPAMNVRVPSEIFLSSAKEAFLRFRYMSPSTELAAVLKDPDFSRAVETCFPNDKETQFYFIAAFVRQDTNGKLFAGIATALSLKGTNLLLGRLGTIGVGISRLMAGLFVLQISYDVVHASIELQSKLRPARELNEQVTRLLTSQLSQTDADIRDIEAELQTDPQNPSLKHLLFKAKDLRNRISKDLLTSG